MLPHKVYKDVELQGFHIPKVPDTRIAFTPTARNEKDFHLLFFASVSEYARYHQPIQLSNGSRSVGRSRKLPPRTLPGF